MADIERDSHSTARDRLLVPVKEAMDMLSMSRTTLYQRLQQGRLRSVKDGRSRLIVVASIHAYVRALEERSASNENPPAGGAAEGCQPNE